MRFLPTSVRCTSPAAAVRGGRRSFLRRFRRDTGATAAVEFALVAAPFFFLLGAIFELALLFLASQLLDTATSDVSRLIRTGQLTSSNTTAAAFKTQVCNRLHVLFDCASLYAESKVYTNFSAIGDLSSLADYQDGSGNFDPTKVTAYDTGSGSSIVVVRVFYSYPVFFKNLLWDSTSAPGGKVMLTGVAAFRNEPF